MNKIYYKSGYKYQLDADYWLQVDILIGPEFERGNYYVNLRPITKGGCMLRVRAGYAWDGPSGPTIDTKTFMRGSLVHDALYQLIREGYLDPSYRKYADNLLKEICREDGMSWLRAQWVYLGVSKFGSDAASTSNIKKVEEAP